MPDIHEIELAESRKKEILIEALSGNRFSARKLTTLMSLIGASEQDCRTLLLAIGARGVRLSNDIEGWGLISRNPVNQPAPNPVEENTEL